MMSGPAVLRFVSAVIVLSFVFTLPAARAETPSLLELRVDGETGETASIGKLLAYGGDTCWLMKRNGELEQFAVNDIRAVRRIEPRFRGFTQVEMRDRLRREFGRDFQVAASPHYLVCALGDRARACARRLERLYGTFQRYFSTRGFDLEEPAFPLVAVVFTDRNAFREHASRIGVRVVPGLNGFYELASNRVFLMENDRVENTLIHEGTHQAAFNMGLHSRIGPAPQWVVEGLATVFEAPGIRDRHGAPERADRLNHERLHRFLDYARNRRESQSLASFIGSDRLFREAPLDAYAQAWALTFYLVETRPSAYAAYLKRIAARDPFAPYPQGERVADFRETFQHDLEWLEVDFVRSVERMQTDQIQYGKLQRSGRSRCTASGCN